MIDETMLEAEEKMDKAVSVTREDLATLRTGRATPQMFSKIIVDYYGAPTPVNQLASFHVPEPRLAVLTPYDKGSMSAIEKAIRDSDLGVNPTNDGQIIRVVFPQLTEERRKDMIKVARHKAEEGRISIRNIRRHAKDTLDSSPATARPARTTCAAPRRSSRTSPTSTSRRSTTRSSTRRTSCSRSDEPPRPEPRCTTSRRPARRLPGRTPGTAAPAVTCRLPSASGWGSVGSCSSPSTRTSRRSSAWWCSSSCWPSAR